MTKEQAKREIDSLDYYLQNHTDDYGEESHTAMMMAIKALEQEPCEDAISRQAAIEVIAATDITNGEEPVFTGKQVIALLKDLDSVIPSRPTGHWIKHKNGVKKDCTTCILDGTDACVSGASDDEVCEGYIAESEEQA